jgi:acid phosphatase type 7
MNSTPSPIPTATSSPDPARRSLLRAGACWAASTALSSIPLAQAAEPAPEKLPDTLTPYLQNPAPDAMTICIFSREASELSVVFHPPQGNRGIEVPATGLRVPGTPWTRWRCRISGLKPGQNYRYQVRYFVNNQRRESSSHTFRTLDPQADSCRALVFNDVHDRRETLQALLQHVRPQEADLILFNGDMINDPSAANGAEAVFSLWEFYVTSLGAHSRPILFIRGNHEVRGSFKEQIRHFFDLPHLADDQEPALQGWHHEVLSGPLRLLMLDTGEDDGPETPEDSYKRPSFWRAFRARQQEWLRQIPTPDHTTKTQPWHVFASHIPLHNPAGWFCQSARDLWLPELRRIGIDLMLAGHDHQWKFLPAGQEFEIARRKDQRDTPPFPVLIGGGPALKEATVIRLQATRTTLETTLLDASGQILHRFTPPEAKS